MSTVGELDIQELYEEFAMSKYVNAAHRDANILLEVKRLRAEVATLKEQNALLTVQVQEGWKLVPVEPTDDMIIAASDGYETGEVIGPSSCYRVMLDAAPALPQQVKSDARDAERYRHVRSGILNCSFIVRQARYDGKWVAMGCDVLDEAIDAAISAQD